MEYRYIVKGAITKFVVAARREDTEYGVITNHEWLEFEKDRIEKATHRACAIKKERSHNNKRECLVYVRENQRTLH